MGCTERGLIRRGTTPILALVFAFAAGCTTADSADPGHLDALPVLSSESDLRIGDFDDPDLGFSRVAGVDLDDEGHIYVVEGSVPEIRVYDTEGSVLRRIGGRGEGPGEFGGAPSFGVVGDTVWTIDGSLQRITLFDREGSVLSTARAEGVPIALPHAYGYVRPQQMRPDGLFTSSLSMLRSLRSDEPPTGVSPTDSIPVPMVLFDAQGEVTDTIGWAGRPPPRMWRPPSEEPSTLELIEVGDRRMRVPAPPTVLPHWMPLVDGYVAVETPLARSPDEGTFTVTRIGLASDTLFHREIRYRPARYTPADLDSIAARAARGGIGIPMGAEPPPVPDNVDQIARRLRSAMDFPEFKLPVQFSWLAQDESVWVRLAPANEGEETASWVILDPDGSPRGRIELPSAHRIVWHRGDVFWAVEPDEYDVPWLVRHRIASD
jgi:hypothetical protein